MDNSSVTLIIKAPNQQIDDQTIKCELSWTINRLKQHLSEVYPSKPPKNEQKLIYSGQLLTDSATLKEVLRQYEGQEAHTVHLVCTQKHEYARFKPPTMANTPEVPVQVSQPPNDTNNTNNIPPNFNPPWMNAPNVNPAQYAAHMAFMQQAYIQYMNQYMQLASNTYSGPVPLITPPQMPPNLLQQPQAAGQQANPAEEVAAAAPAPVEGDPENAERDWLDNFYVISRMMVLFSVVYFYSSLLRFAFVLFLGVTLYLYQIGFFRLPYNNNNNNNNTVPADPAPQEEQAPSRLMVVWTFFTTFFASLLPEIPNAV